MLMDATSLKKAGIWYVHTILVLRIEAKWWKHDGKHQMNEAPAGLWMTSTRDSMYVQGKSSELTGMIA